MALFPTNTQLLMEVHRIENGYLLVVARTNGQPAIFHCEHEASIGEKIIALSTEAKLKGEQLELPLTGGSMYSSSLAHQIQKLISQIDAQ